jgi:hypothetical protein
VVPVLEVPADEFAFTAVQPRPRTAAVTGRPTDGLPHFAKGGQLSGRRPLPGYAHVLPNELCD